MKYELIIGFALSLLFAGCASQSDENILIEEDFEVQNLQAEDFFEKHDIFYGTAKSGEIVLMKNNENLGQYDDVQIYSDGDYVLLNVLSEKPYYESSNLNAYELSFHNNIYPNYRSFSKIHDYLIYFVCLSKEYDPYYDYNGCTKEALYANEKLIEAHAINRIPDESLLGKALGDASRGVPNFFSVYFIDYPNVYYADGNDKNLSYFNLETEDRGESKFLREGAINLYNGELFRFEDDNIDTKYFLGNKLYAEFLGDDSASFSNAKVIGDSIYQIIYKHNEKTLVLIKDKLKVATIVTDFSDDQPDNGNEIGCTFSVSDRGKYCILGDNIIAKSGYGSSEIAPRDSSIVDKYLVNGVEINFHPYWTTDWSDKEFEQIIAISFVLDTSGNIEYLVVEATNSEGSGYNIYLVDYFGGGRISQPSLLIKDIHHGMFGGLEFVVKK